jgi:hypothetical protein
MNALWPSNFGLCGGWEGADAEAAEDGLHVGAEGFVVAVGAGPPGGFASGWRGAHAGQDRGNGLVTEGQQGGDKAGGVRECSSGARGPA